MTLVNCTVVSTNNEVVHPWKILHVGDDKVSIGDFYHTTIEPTLDTTQGPLTKAYLGKSKDCLDLIDMSIELNVAVKSFGPFIKFVIDNGIVPIRAESTAGRPSAFDILMSAQQSLSLPFNDVYGSQTSEEHRPSMRKRSHKQRTLPFHGKLQYICQKCRHYS